ncbi:MAG: NAD-dependent epimerase/dehydratase family protein [Candidatus Bathyarchaeia archaeon]
MDCDAVASENYARIGGLAFSSLQGTNVLVTGGAGFIGSHLVDVLLCQGAHVKVADDLSRGSIRNLMHCLDEIEFVNCDLACPESAPHVLKDCDVCYHLAAVVGDVQWMNTHPSEIFRSLLINYHVIDACRKLDTAKLLFVSSACTYPVGLQSNPELPPLREEDMLTFGAMPDGDYGWTKLLGEIQCKAYNKTYGTSVVVVRPFNPYGPRESFCPEDSHVIPALIRRALNREKPFVVWGDGRQRRAFTYVTDLVEGMILACQKLPNAEPVNLGESTDISINDLAELILKLTGFDTPIVHDVSKLSGVRSRKSDMSKAMNLLDWHPKVSLEKGLRNTVEWYLKNQKLSSLIYG